MIKKMVLVMLLALLAIIPEACDSKKPTDTRSNSQPAVTLTILMNNNIQSFNKGEDVNNNEIIDYLEQLSGFNLKYQILPSEGVEEKRALIMASGDLPDLMQISSRNIYLEYAAQNYLTDLTGQIDGHQGLRMTKSLDPVVYNMSLVDGKAYAVCTPSNGSPAPDALVVDLQVAKAIGLDPTKPDMTLDGIRRMFAAAKAVSPGKIVYSGAGSGTRSYKLADFRWLYAAYDVDTTWRVNGSQGLDFCAITDDMYDCLKFIAEMYNKGYLDPGYATGNTQLLQKRMANHDSSFYGLSWYDWPPASIFTDESSSIAFFPILGQAIGKDETTGQDQESVVQNYMVVPVGSSHVDEVLDYLAILCSESVYEFLFYGTEGKQFSFDASGKRVPLNDPTNYRMVSGGQFYVYYYIYEDFAQRTNRLNYNATGRPVDQERYNIYGLQLKSKLNPAYNMPKISTYIEHIADLNDCCAKWFLKIAIGAVDLDDGWQSFLAEFNKLGGQEVIRAVNNWYIGQ